MKLGEFAMRAGVVSKTLANIESGHQSTVSVEVIRRIADALGITDAGELIAVPEPEATQAPPPRRKVA